MLRFSLLISKKEYTRLYLQLLYLEKVRKRSEPKEQTECINTYFPSNGQPFSYANNIFIPQNANQEREKFIVAH